MNDAKSVAERKAVSIVDLLDTLNDEERAIVFGVLRMVYCKGCGRKQPPGRRCQCENDE